MNIFCYISLNDNQRDFLKKKIDDNFFFMEDSKEKSFENFMNCEVCFGNPDLDWVTKSKNLKWIQLESVGFEEYSKVKISTSSLDIVDQLNSLNELYKSGVLTKEEFEKAKKKILN